MRMDLTYDMHWEQIINRKKAKIYAKYRIREQRK